MQIRYEDLPAWIDEYMKRYTPKMRKYIDDVTAHIAAVKPRMYELSKQGQEEFKKLEDGRADLKYQYEMLVSIFDATKWLSHEHETFKRREKHLKALETHVEKAKKAGVFAMYAKIKRLLPSQEKLLMAIASEDLSNEYVLFNHSDVAHLKNILQLCADTNPSHKETPSWKILSKLASEMDQSTSSSQ